MVPRALLFGNPRRASATISPDGRWLAWLAPLDGVLNLWRAPADQPDAARPLTRDTGRGIRHYAWTFNGRHMLYLRDRDGDENWHVHALDTIDMDVKDLTPYAGVMAHVAGLSRDIRDEVLVSMNRRDKRFPDVYRIRLDTGETTLVVQNPGLADFDFGEDFHVRLASEVRPDGGSTILKPAGGDGPVREWAPWLSFDPVDAKTSHGTGLNRDGTLLYLRDSRGRDTAALTQVDIASGATTVLFADPRADVGGYLTDPDTGVPVACSVDYQRLEYHALDPALQPDLDFLASQDIGDWALQSRTEDDAVWLIASITDRHPGATYRYERAARTLVKLFDARPELAAHASAPMQPLALPTRDGLTLVAYLTLPAGIGDPATTMASTTGAADVGDVGDVDDVDEGVKATDARDAQAAPSASRAPSAPAPLVLLVHGGPWARDHFGYDAQHQWLADRGYAVMSLNFRGSTGFGKAFVNAGDGEWGRKMDDDLLDAVDWAIAQGIADPDRVAIMGGSYGGYATLAALTRNPERYACGIDIVGPSNLQTLLDSVPEYWESQKTILYQAVGDPRTEAGQALLRERSPLFLAERIRRPLLIAQGANDPRVKQAEADQMVAAMQQAGVPVTYALYPDEGHGFARPENRLSFFALAEAFLARYLGGALEPAEAATLSSSSLRLEADPDGLAADLTGSDAATPTTSAACNSASGG
ncbi:S9 family peptidase [Robbsia sp. Bb-Pol-6]|uniref:S9 family peptidase n=1 Tax=Robbsia betulipollinis TaxID=2981849 RepID=A0ABT3ZLZ4_9BURK|nr:S9 family peptidase [Robbsia betulipollinis]MCY0387300.1 S9 family peptidase [Robbsia betulipollinis]